jgi:hypothetical protein
VCLESRYGLDASQKSEFCTEVEGISNVRKFGMFISGMVALLLYLRVTLSRHGKSRGSSACLPTLSPKSFIFNDVSLSRPWKRSILREVDKIFG